MRWISGNQRIVGLLSVLLLSLTLGGCLTLNEAVSSGVSAGTALVTTSLGLPPAATVAAVAGADLATGVITEEVEILQDVAEIVNPWQAFAVAFNNLLNHAFELIIAISVGVLVIPMIISFVAGVKVPNRRTKETEQENRVLKRMMDKGDG